MSICYFICCSCFTFRDSNSYYLFYDISICGYIRDCKFYIHSLGYCIRCCYCINYCNTLISWSCTRDTNLCSCISLIRLIRIVWIIWVCFVCDSSCYWVYTDKCILKSSAINRCDWSCIIFSTFIKCIIYSIYYKICWSCICCDCYYLSYFYYITIIRCNVTDYYCYI